MALGCGLDLESRTQGVSTDGLQVCEHLSGSQPWQVVSHLNLDSCNPNVTTTGRLCCTFGLA